MQVFPVPRHFEPFAGRPQDGVAVLIPCFNEAAAIGKVIADFRAALPEATVYVYDNNSGDETVAIARAAGATVRREPRQGKGHVIRRMFADIEAEAYVLVDGDDTYEAGAASAMVRLLREEQLDMVNGCRVSDTLGAYRPGHRFGNRLFTGIVARLFGRQLTDMLSGYRVFSRRFVKSFPALSSGFETETEFSVHALDLRMPVAEVATAYRDRPAGSVSKLRTVSDGLRILHMILVLVKEQKPLPLFAVAGAGLALAGTVCGLSIIGDFIETGIVPRVPTAVLATGLMMLAFLSFTCGLILDSVARGRKEIKRLAYLAIPAVSASA